MNMHALLKSNCMVLNLIIRNLVIQIFKLNVKCIVFNRIIYLIRGFEYDKIYLK